MSWAAAGRITSSVTATRRGREISPAAASALSPGRQAPPRLDQGPDHRASPGQRGVDQAGLDQGDPDVAGLEFLAKRMAEPDHAPLAGDVQRLAPLGGPG